MYIVHFYSMPGQSSWLQHFRGTDSI